MSGQRADLVRFQVTATLEFEGSVTDQRAFEIAKSELERHLWTWNPKVVQVARIDGDA